MTLRGCGVVAAAVLLAVVSESAGQVVLRGGVALDDDVTGFSSQGVIAAPRLAGGGVQRVIPWDMVREVGGEKAGGAAGYFELSDKAWRARSRWMRGDYAMAEPLLEELFEKCGGEDGPLTLRVSEGLLRCRLVRGDQAGAAAAWLTALRLQGSDAGLPADAEPRARKGAGAGGAESSRALAAVIDPETGLCPALPPVWVNTEDVAAVVGPLMEIAGHEGGEAESARVLARLYARAAALDTRSAVPDGAGIGGDVEASGPGAGGVALVDLIVRSRDPDAAVRRAAQARLAAGLSGDADTWKEAWRRAALGRSLLMETGEAQRSEGLVHLLHLPARFAHTQPYLAGVAVVEASQELKRRGGMGGGGSFAGAASRMLADLKLEEPFHPALRAIAAEVPVANPAGARP